MDNNNLNFIKMKHSKLDKYVICDNNNKKINMVLEEVYVPFGIEKWNKMFVLNMEINPNKNNTQYNICATMKSYDKMLEEKITKHFGDNVINKTYYSFLKESKYGYILRSHIHGYPKIYKMINGSDIKLTSADILKENVKATLILSSLWFTDDAYGVTWDIDNIELL